MSFALDVDSLGLKYGSSGGGGSFSFSEVSLGSTIFFVGFPCLG